MYKRNQHHARFYVVLLSSTAGLGLWSMAFGAGEEMLKGLDTASGFPRITCVQGTTTPSTPSGAAGIVTFDSGSTMIGFLSMTDSGGSVNGIFDDFSLGANFQSEHQERMSTYADYLIVHRDTTAIESAPSVNVSLNDIGKAAAAAGPVQFFAICGDAFYTGQTHGNWIQARWSSEDFSQSESDQFGGKVGGTFKQLVSASWSGNANSLQTLRQHTMRGEIASAGVGAAPMPAAIDDVIKVVNSFPITNLVPLGWFARKYTDSSIAGVTLATPAELSIINALRQIGIKTAKLGQEIQQQIADATYAKAHPSWFGDPSNLRIDNQIIKPLQDQWSQLFDALEECYRSGSATSTACSSLDQKTLPSVLPQRGQLFTGDFIQSILRHGANNIPYDPKSCWMLVSVHGSYEHYTDPRYQQSIQYSDTGAGRPDHGPRLWITDKDNPAKQAYYQGIPNVLRLPPGALLRFEGSDVVAYVNDLDYPTPSNPIRVMVYWPLSPDDFANAECPKGFSCPATYPSQLGCFQQAKLKSLLPVGWLTVK
jgi:hypothetical protein